MTILNSDSPRPFHPTLEDVDEWFETLNFHIFNGELDLFDSIRIANTTRARSWGWISCNIHDTPDTDVELRLHNTFPDEDHFISVLGHEMVHLYQIRSGDSGCHNNIFYSFKEKFEDLGLKLLFTMDAKPIKADK